MGLTRADHVAGSGISETGIPLWPLYNGTPDVADIPAGFVAMYYVTTTQFKVVGRNHAGTLFSGLVTLS